MKFMLIIYGFRLFIVGGKVSYWHHKLGNRLDKSKDYTDGKLIRYSNKYTNACMKFDRLENHFKEIIQSRK